MLETKLALVTAVRHVRDHVLWLRFSDGLSGEVDLAGELRGDMLAPLRNPQLFAQAHLEHGTVTWPNGLDWSPESLYERLRSAKGLPPQFNNESARTRLDHAARMPEISRFFGIVIRMFATEHGPPYFHAIRGEYQVAVTIRDGIVTGRFPRTALRLVLEWGELHHDELLANWERMSGGEAPRPIPPLE
jgi:hypothetical protein